MSSSPETEEIFKELNDVVLKYIDMESSLQYMINIGSAGDYSNFNRMVQHSVEIKKK